MLRSPRTISRALLGSIVAAAAIAAGGCGGSSHHSASTTPTATSKTLTGSTTTTPASAPSAHTGDNHLSSIFGGAAQLIGAPAQELQTLHALGVDRIRIDVRWDSLAPKPASRHAPAGFAAADPASYTKADWAPYDNAIAAARSQGIKVLLTVGGPGPLWAEAPGDPLQAKEPVGIWKPNPAQFGAFVKAVATRYDGHYRAAGKRLPRVSWWSVWNEPNYGQDLAPQVNVKDPKVEVAPSLYRGLLDAAWTALHATGHGGDTLLFGDSAPRGQTTGTLPGNFGGMVPLRFLRALYCVNSSEHVLTGSAATERGCPADGSSASFRAANPALFKATGFAAHLYQQGALSPTQRVPDEPDYADFASIPELEQTLDRSQAAYGDDTKLAIYSTEFGIHTDPPEVGSASPQQAAAFMNQAEYLSWRNPRIKTFDQYLLNDPSGNSDFDTGLVFSSGKAKPSLDAYRLPLWLPDTTARSGRKLEVWGDVRPAHFAAGTQRVQIQFQPASGGAFRTVRTVRIRDREGYFDTGVAFPGAGTVRLQWTYPGGPAIQSRSVTLTS